MRTYLVLRSRYYDHKDHIITDRVTAMNMAVQLEESTSVVIFRDGEGRISGIVTNYDAIYEESSVTSSEEAVTVREET